MKNGLFLTGHVLVADILLAFEPMVDAELLERLDTALEKRTDERISFDDCEVLAEDAIDALDDADKLPVPEDLTDVLDEMDMRGLAEAIRCRETEQAELLLDRLFGHEPAIREWIDRGRYSKKARETKAAQRPAMRAAA
jgi:hypothetical protein